ncbi:hypothetical protein JCM4914_43740 [Streptomyces platensis subsp. malvinus]
MRARPTRVGRALIRRIAARRLVVRAKAPGRAEGRGGVWLPAVAGTDASLQERRHTCPHSRTSLFGPAPGVTRPPGRQEAAAPSPEGPGQVLAAQDDLFHPLPQAIGDLWLLGIKIYSCQSRHWLLARLIFVSSTRSSETRQT